MNAADIIKGNVVPCFYFTPPLHPSSRISEAEKHILSGNSICLAWSRERCAASPAALNPPALHSSKVWINQSPLLSAARLSSALTFKTLLSQPNENYMVSSVTPQIPVKLHKSQSGRLCMGVK